jgi:hypothetical protein
LLNKFSDDVSSALRFSLKEQMRPINRYRGNLRFYSPNLFETRFIDQTILFRL